MFSRIDLGDIAVDVFHKDIKNIHLSVNPPAGKVRISAPMGMELDIVRVFAISKLSWIKKARKKMLEQERETPREYLERESHYLWGKRYLMTIIEENKPPEVSLAHNTLILTVRPGATEDKRQAVVDEWYRNQLRKKAAPLISKWESRLEVKVNRLFVQRMKTRWGSCNPQRGYVRLNTHIAKKPAHCLEYLIVHEMLHILEPTHNARFKMLMEKYMPQWEFHRKMLNRLPVSHVDWRY
ncbi:M48 family metallopeptidase [Maridesulfovibrio ferrireducens]|uniref:M48 family metallopeptidase n=1 Tax=Maridesulfovibrio ferrireducens TaxID=246191 RepID=UPI001A26FF3D|nr:SprT family zinc-dependent metalloprotease [Maridesulfovibrio ferrireducens]MBI9109970.1 M48 family metallopeptidase [Maridesulfovibrio ferrireducens]